MNVEQIKTKLNNVEDKTLPVAILENNTLTALEGMCLSSSVGVVCESFGGIVSPMDVNEVIEQLEFFSNKEEVTHNNKKVSSVVCGDTGRVTFVI